MKPTQLVCSHPWAKNLERKIPAHLKILFDSAAGVKDLPDDPHCGHRRISGAEGLKGSQVYPWDFVCAVRDEYLDGVDKGGMDFEDDESDSDTEVPMAHWEQVAKACAFPEVRLQELGGWLN